MLEYILFILKNVRKLQFAFDQKDHNNLPPQVFAYQFDKQLIKTKSILKKVENC